MGCVFYPELDNDSVRQRVDWLMDVALCHYARIKLCPDHCEEAFDGCDCFVPSVRADVSNYWPSSRQNLLALDWVMCHALRSFMSEWDEFLRFRTMDDGVLFLPWRGIFIPPEDLFAKGAVFAPTV
jgi:hypothetical protein